MNSALWLHPTHMDGSNGALKSVGIPYIHGSCAEAVLQHGKPYTQTCMQGLRCNLSPCARHLEIPDNRCGYVSQITLLFAEVVYVGCGTCEMLDTAEQQELVAVIPHAVSNQMSSSTETASGCMEVWFVCISGGARELQCLLDTMVAAGALLSGLHQKYDVSHKVLARGSTATVHLASHRAVEDGTITYSSSALVAKTTRAELCAKQEVAALVAIGSHPNIVPFRAVFASTSALGRSWTLLFNHQPGSLLQMLRLRRLLNTSDPSQRWATSLQHSPMCMLCGTFILT